MLSIENSALENLKQTALVFKSFSKDLNISLTLYTSLSLYFSLFSFFFENSLRGSDTNKLG